MKVVKVLQIDVVAALKNPPDGDFRKIPAWTLSVLPPNTLFHNRTPDGKFEIFYVEEEGAATA